MTKLLLSLIFFISANSFAITCTEYYRATGNENFSFPSSSETVNMRVDGKVCYKGRDITEWVAGDGMEVTSFVIPNGNETVAIVTANEINPETYKQKSRIRVIFIKANGTPGQFDFIKEHYSNERPESELTNMEIVGYNYEKGIVYFESQAWATSNAIHAFTVPFDGDYSKVKEKYIIDGSLKWVMMSGITLKDKEEYPEYLIVSRGFMTDKNGRDYADFIVSPSGKVICIANTKKENWRLNLACEK